MKVFADCKVKKDNFLNYTIKPFLQKEKMLVNSLLNDKNLGQSILEVFAEDKMRVTEKLKFVYRTVAFSPFPTMFSKGFFLKVVKRRDYVVKSFIFLIFPQYFYRYLLKG